mmetsp:Transcript_47183/g.148090  ORF Transcript_47183/g.148090 Transcript_47183/m.148090 type:complete len:284 (-) Transcript_47183:577-1428(-)
MPPQRCLLVRAAHLRRPGLAREAQQHQGLAARQPPRWPARRRRRRLLPPGPARLVGPVRAGGRLLGRRRLSRRWRLRRRRPPRGRTGARTACRSSGRARRRGAARRGPGSGISGRCLAHCGPLRRLLGGQQQLKELIPAALAARVQAEGGKPGPQILDTQAVKVTGHRCASRLGSCRLPITPEGLEGDLRHRGVRPQRTRLQHQVLQRLHVAARVRGHGPRLQAGLVLQLRQPRVLRRAERLVRRGHLLGHMEALSSGLVAPELEVDAVPVPDGPPEAAPEGL